MPGFSTYLFDLDGTLIDSIELIMSSFRHTMRTHLGTVPPASEWRAGFGTPLRAQLARYACDSDQVADMAATYRAHNRAQHDRLVKPYAGIHEVVLRLRDQGSKLGIVTSKNRAATQHGLRHCELDRFFEALVTSDDVTEHKPRPAPVFEALTRLGASASRDGLHRRLPLRLHGGAGGRGVDGGGALGAVFPRDARAARARPLARIPGADTHPRTSAVEWTSAQSP